MSTQSKRALLFSGAAVAIAVLVAIHFVRPAREITFEMDGAPGQTVTAAFTVDGATTRETLLTPSRQSFKASRVSYSIAREDGPGEADLSVRIFVDDVPAGSWRGDAPGQSLHGSIRPPSLFHLIGAEYEMGTGE